MTGRHPHAAGEPHGPWYHARAELAIAAVVLASCALAAYAVAGGPAAVVVALVFSAVALVVVDRLPAPAPGPPVQPEVTTGRRLPSRWSINYWRWRTDLTAAIASMGSYQTNLGPDLQHLLAARLSERHGVSLYQQPDLARSLLCPRARDLDLWPWVDPQRPLADRLDSPGIPRQALVRLVERLERL